MIVASTAIAPMRVSDIMRVASASAYSLVATRSWRSTRELIGVPMGSIVG
jgi:hypothetical protein